MTRTAAERKLLTGSGPQAQQQKSASAEKAGKVGPAAERAGKVGLRRGQDVGPPDQADAQPVSISCGYLLDKL